MGSTSRDERNTTENIDSRQIRTTTLEDSGNQTVEYEDSSEGQNNAGGNIENTTLEDSGNTNVEDSGNTEIDYEDSSQGQINATGNVTIQSEAVSLASIEAANRSAVEASAALQSGFASFSNQLEAANGRAIDGNVKATEAAFDFTGGAVSSLEDVSKSALKSNEDVSKAAFNSNEAVSLGAFNFAEEALEENSGVLQTAFDANQAGFESVLNFLGDSLSEEQRAIENTFSTGLNFLTTNLQDANELSLQSQSNAFQSTVGGLADKQQTTLLIGMGMVAIVLLVIFFFGGRK